MVDLSPVIRSVKLVNRQEGHIPSSPPILPLWLLLYAPLQGLGLEFQLQKYLAFLCQKISLPLVTLRLKSILTDFSKCIRSFNL